MNDPEPISEKVWCGVSSEIDVCVCAGGRARVKCKSK